MCEIFNFVDLCSKGRMIPSSGIGGYSVVSGTIHIVQYLAEYQLTDTS